jgi:hypothetical protein
MKKEKIYHIKQKKLIRGSNEIMRKGFKNGANTILRHFEDIIRDSIIRGYTSINNGILLKHIEDTKEFIEKDLEKKENEHKI